MNRSILIVICDFWILSLLVLAKFDAPDNPPTTGPVRPNASGVGESDVVGVLKMALAEEARSRTQLATNVTELERRLRAREQALGTREQELQAIQQALKEKEQVGQLLAEQKTQLLDQVAATQTNIEFLRSQLQTASTESLLSQEQLKAMQTSLQKKEEELAASRQRMTELDRQREAAQTEKQQIATRLEVTEAEKRLVVEQVAALRNDVQTAREEVKVVRQEKERVQEEKERVQEHAEHLAAGVGELAEKSTELSQEIREYRPVASNTLFNEMATNRVAARFSARRSTLFGIQLNNDREAQMILATDGKQHFALCHLSDTPLNFSTPGIGYEQFQIILSRGGTNIPVSRMVFSGQDPRVVVVPLKPEEAAALGAKVYRLASDPYRFQEALLVGANEGYYGECQFKIDLTAPDYVKMDRSAFRIFSAKFNPSRGDVVLTRTGELLGMMANNQYCVLIDRYVPGAEIVCSDHAAPKEMASLLSRFHSALGMLPAKLQ